MRFIFTFYFNIIFQIFFIFFLWTVLSWSTWTNYKSLIVLFWPNCKNGLLFLLQGVNFNKWIHMWAFHLVSCTILTDKLIKISILTYFGLMKIRQNFCLTVHSLWFWFYFFLINWKFSNMWNGLLFSLCIQSYYFALINWFFNKRLFFLWKLLNYWFKVGVGVAYWISLHCKWLLLHCRRLRLSHWNFFWNVIVNTLLSIDVMIIFRSYMATISIHQISMEKINCWLISTVFFFQIYFKWCALKIFSVKMLGQIPWFIIIVLVWVLYHIVSSKMHSKIILNFQSSVGDFRKINLIKLNVMDVLVLVTDTNWWILWSLITQNFFSLAMFICSVFTWKGNSWWFSRKSIFLRLSFGWLFNLLFIAILSLCCCSTICLAYYFWFQNHSVWFIITRCFCLRFFLLSLSLWRSWNWWIFSNTFLMTLGFCITQFIHYHANWFSEISTMVNVVIEKVSWIINILIQICSPKITPINLHLVILFENFLNLFVFQFYYML